MSAPFSLRAESGPHAGQTYTLTGANATIGRQDDNTIVLDDARLSRHHLRLDLHDGQLTVTDLGSANGTRVNGQAVTTGQTLHSGDRIQIGDTVLVVEGGSAPAGATVTTDLHETRTGPLPGGVVPRLIIQGGPLAGREYSLNRPAQIAGRQPGLDLTLDDSQASRQHARFEVRDGQVFVTDLGSANGTRVNGQPINGTQLLREGDVVQIGTTQLRATGIAPAGVVSDATVVAGAGGVSNATVVAGDRFAAAQPPPMGPPPAWSTPPAPVAPVAPPPPAQRKSSTMPLVLAGVVAVLLLLCLGGAGGAFLFVRGRSSATATPGLQGTAIAASTNVAATAQALATSATAKPTPTTAVAAAATTPTTGSAAPTAAASASVTQGSGGGNPSPPGPTSVAATATTAPVPTRAPTPTTAPAPTRAATTAVQPTAPRPTATTGSSTGGGSTYTVQSVGLKFTVPAGWQKSSDDQAGTATFISPDSKALFAVTWTTSVPAGMTAQKRVQQELDAAMQTDPNSTAANSTVSAAKIGGQPGYTSDQYDFTSQKGTKFTELDAAVVLDGQALYFFQFAAIQGQFSAHSDDFV
ncbi:MAG: FHA domain-containing protein, partial [Thermomicrobiales bacterium]